MRAAKIIIDEPDIPSVAGRSETETAVAAS
jgi:hypothetical protein